MRILFCDCDGVINAGWAVNKPEYKRNGVLFAIPQKLKYVQEILERGNAKLVMSSTWRNGYFDLQKGLQTRDSDDYIAMRDKFSEYGIEIFGHTPLTNGSTNRRGKEISMWLDAWDGEPIESYCLLDDLNGCFLRSHSGHLVRTSFAIGLLPKHVELAVKLLNKPLSGDKKEAIPEPATMVHYSWSEDGEVELCERMEDTLLEDTVCDHCEQKMKAGEKAVFLFSLDDGTEYALHPDCAKKGCFPS